MSPLVGSLCRIRAIIYSFMGKTDYARYNSIIILLSSVTQSHLEFFVCCHIKTQKIPFQRNKNFSFPSSMQYFTRMHSLSHGSYLAAWCEFYLNRIQMEENMIKWDVA